MIDPFAVGDSDEAFADDWFNGRQASEAALLRRHVEADELPTGPWYDRLRGRVLKLLGGSS